MNRILAPNGHPLPPGGSAPKPMVAGQHQIDLALPGLTPDGGVVFQITVDGRPYAMALAPEQAATIGVELIGLAKFAQHQRQTGGVARPVD